MGLDWAEPFKIAFEIGMWGLGWMLVFIIAAFFVFLTYAIIAAFITTVRGKNKKQSKPGIITFDKG